MSELNYIEYFGVKIKNDERIRLTEENYCTPAKELDSDTKRFIQHMKVFCEKHNRKPNIPNEIFADEEHYTDTYVEKHYKDCMENFKLNMNYFNSLDKNEFNDYLDKFIEKKKFIETKDLNELKDISGIYIIVLDEYKQVYIGTSKDIKRRILSHWRKKKEFSRLIYGKVDTSILSIDSFGALDTTRIYYKELGYSALFDAEEKYVSAFKNDYRLNRVAGGIDDEDGTLRNLKLFATAQLRDLK